MLSRSVYIMQFYWGPSRRSNGRGNERYQIKGTNAHDYWYDDLARKWNGVEDTPLDIDEDFVAVKKELLPCQSKWKGMGMVLRLRSGDLEALEVRHQGDPDKCQSDMLMHWLRKNYNTKEISEPSWRSLVVAVAHPVGANDQALAVKIGDKHRLIQIPAAVYVTATTCVQSGIGVRHEDTECVGSYRLADAHHMMECLWYHGQISYEEAEQRLCGAPNGHFLVRDSESHPGGYAISLMHQAKVTHFLIQRTAAGMYEVRSRGPGQPFLEISHLIEHYRHHYITAKGLERLEEHCPRKSLVLSTPKSSHNSMTVDDDKIYLDLGNDYPATHCSAPLGCNRGASPKQTEVIPGGKRKCNTLQRRHSFSEAKRKLSCGYNPAPYRDCEPDDLVQEVTRRPMSCAIEDSWYHGKIFRKEAEEKLQNSPEGYFLVRESATHPGSYALSTKHQGKVKHRVIFHREDCGTYELRGSKKPFLKITKLIKYYRQNYISTSGEILGTPCPHNTDAFQESNHGHNLSSLSGTHQPSPPSTASPEIQPHTVTQLTSFPQHTSTSTEECQPLQRKRSRLINGKNLCQSHSLPKHAEYTVMGDGISKAEVSTEAHCELHLPEGTTIPQNVSATLTSLVNQSTTDCNVSTSVGTGKYHNTSITCCIAYTPHTRGRHKLCVKVNSQEIKSSPFDVFVSYPPRLLGRPVRVISGVSCPKGICIGSGKDSIIVCESAHESITAFGKDAQRTKETFPSLMVSMQAVCTDRMGHLFTTDPENNCVQKLKDSKTRFWNGMGLHKPMGIELRGERLYVCDSGNSRIQILDKDTLNPLFSFGKKGTGPGNLITPVDIAFDSKGHSYVADSRRNRIVQFSLDCQYVKEFWMDKRSDLKLNCPQGVSVGPDDFVYVTDCDHSVTVFYMHNQSGEFRILANFGGHGQGMGQFQHPTGIAVNEDGFIYVCDRDNSRIQVF